MLIVALLALPSLAGTGAYQTCTAAADRRDGPTELLAIGPGTEFVTQQSQTRAHGLWRMTCDGGARFDPGATHPTPGPLSHGAVITAIDPVALACFDAACALPKNLCLAEVEGHVRAVHCVSGTPAGKSTWEGPPTQDTIPVVIDGRVIAAHPAAASRAPRAVIHRGDP